MSASKTESRYGDNNTPGFLESVGKVFEHSPWFNPTGLEFHETIFGPYFVSDKLVRIGLVEEILMLELGECAAKAILHETFHGELIRACDAVRTGNYE